jgi:RNA polymerase sigma-70 factor (ECF subfamily)
MAARTRRQAGSTDVAVRIYGQPTPSHSPHGRFFRTPMDDTTLFERIRRGDEAAFDELFRKWYATLVRLAEAIVRESGPAEEIVQDVMLEIWRRRASLVIPESPRAYLLQSTRNRALNHIRRRNVERIGEPRISAALRQPDRADAFTVEEELDAALRAAVAGLPDRCREVFELSRVHGLKYGEIADALDISVKTVEAQMGKALRVLRERLAPWLPGGDGESRDEEKRRD